MLVVVVIVDVADSQSMVKTGHKGASGQATSSAKLVFD